MNDPNIEIAKQVIKKRLDWSRSEADGLFKESERLHQKAREAVAQANAFQTALDILNKPETYA